MTPANDPARKRTLEETVQHLEYLLTLERQTLALLLDAGKITLTDLTSARKLAEMFISGA